MQRECQPTMLGKIIRARRKKLGLTLEECGRKIGISRQAVSQVEVGKNRGSNDKMVEELAQVLDLDERELLLTRPNRKLCQKKRNNSVGKFLTKQRLRIHLTQEEVAKRAGLSTATVSEKELGKRLSRLSTLFKIAWALECEIPVSLLLEKKSGRRLKKKVASDFTV